MSTAKTEQEVQQEIEKLQEMKPKVRPYTAFGDNNRNAIQAQIDALMEEMDDGDVYDKLGTEEDEFDDGEWTQHEVDTALQAIQWRDGDAEESPSEGWEPLIQIQK